MNFSAFLRKANFLKRRCERCRESVRQIELTAHQAPLSEILIKRLNCYLEEVTEKKRDFDYLVTNFTDDTSSSEAYSEDAILGLTDEIIEIFVETKGVIMSLLPLVESRPSAEATGSATQQPTPIVKLPKLQLPHFAGDFTQWMLFHDAFEVTIHQNASLSSTQKFQYLISCLQGEAKEVIQGLPISDTNYCIAWNLLQKRFHNVRKLVSLHVSKIIDMPPISGLSVPTLRTFLSTFSENTQALKALGYDITTENVLLLTILLRKLDLEIRKRFEETRKDIHVLPTVVELINFLERDCAHLEDALIDTRQKSSKIQTSRRISKTSLISIKENICSICNNGNHSIYQCEVFRNKPLSERHSIVKEKGWCFNCLGTSHNVKLCKSKQSCKHCRGRHHSLLHKNSETVGNKREQSSTMREGDNSQIIATRSPADFVGLSATKEETLVLLATTLIKLSNGHGSSQIVRGVLDSAAQSSFVTERCEQLLNLTRRRVTNPVAGLSQSRVKTSGMVYLNLSTVSGTVLANSHPMIILENITPSLPRLAVSSEVKKRVKSFILADPTFDLPGPIDVLIGADLFPYVLSGAQFTLGKGLPMALDTVFGIVLMGNAPIALHQDHAVETTNLLACDFDLNTSIQRFWKLEEPPSRIISDVDKACEEHFQKTHSRDETGRYVMRLPFKENYAPLGCSSISAKRRFFNLEKKFSSNPEFKKCYVEFMRDYLISGHMKPYEHSFDLEHYFLPHHGVFKHHESPPKIRVVFDASARTSSGSSLNDILYTGTKLQNKICDLIFCSRFYEVLFSCDIRQMYRQIKIHPDDQRYQLIFWRSEPSEPLVVYQLTTVTYGVTSSPFMAIRTLHQLALDEGANFPRASKILKHQTFVDDIIAGADNLNEASSLQEELKQLLAKGGFELRKWCSNSSALLSRLAEEERVSSTLPEHQHCLLGLKWNSSLDQYSYSINVSDGPATKRFILSTIARIYDPCGWLTPIVLWAKSFMQLLWTLGLQWDDPVPAHLIRKWEVFLRDIVTISRIKISRPLSLGRAEYVELHGFSDASERGYAACVYSRSCQMGGRIQINLLIAKSRVSPLKKITLPRLELCGAHMLSQMLDYAYSLLSESCSIESVTAWCDSTIALTWIKTPPHRLKTLVANRVAEIQEWAPPHQWQYINSQDNPADCGFRGLLPSQLPDHSLWWHGPGWLSLPKEEWPSFTNMHAVDENELELKPLTVNALVSIEQTEWDLLFKYSSWLKILHTVAYVKRFIFNCKQSRKYTGFLKCEELQRATFAICKLIQQSKFQKDLTALQRNQPCSTRIQRLAPFLDENGLIRVGGRLRHASLPDEVKHPILLPKKHHVINLIIDYYHLKYLHAGPQLLQAVLSRSFWILSARSVIRSRIFKCIKCFRCRPRNVPPLMGDLPKFRVNQTHAFANTGMDYGGPFQVKVHNLKNAKVFKVYFCIFICFCTKAVHIEVVTDLTSEAFIAALTRFVSRRGIRSNLYSDCGTNFVGASSHLKKVFKNFFVSIREELNHFINQQSIKFHFLPPSAPHIGGLWESAVKAVKHHLRRVMGMQILTLSEFITLLTKVEAMLNSRPLTPISSDPSELSALTPGHFLIGRHLQSIPDDDFSDARRNRLGRWQTVQALFQRLWKRWNKEYLHTLQQRSKWTLAKDGLKEGDLVLVQEPNAPPLVWCMGRIIATSPGKDGVVRVVHLRTSKGTLSRPAIKVFPLPIDS